MQMKETSISWQNEWTTVPLPSESVSSVDRSVLSVFTPSVVYWRRVLDTTVTSDMLKSERERNIYRARSEQGDINRLRVHSINEESNTLGESEIDNNAESATERVRKCERGESEISVV